MLAAKKPCENSWVFVLIFILDNLKGVSIIKQFPPFWKKILFYEIKKYLGTTAVYYNTLGCALKALPNEQLN